MTLVKVYISILFCILLKLALTTLRWITNPIIITLLKQIKPAPGEKLSIKTPKPGETTAWSIRDIAIQTDIALPINDLGTFSINAVFINILSDELQSPNRRLPKNRISVKLFHARENKIPIDRRKNSVTVPLFDIFLARGGCEKTR